MDAEDMDKVKKWNAKEKCQTKAEAEAEAERKRSQNKGEGIGWSPEPGYVYPGNQA